MQFFLIEQSTEPFLLTFLHGKNNSPPVSLNIFPGVVNTDYIAAHSRWKNDDLYAYNAYICRVFSVFFSENCLMMVDNFSRIGRVGNSKKERGKMSVLESQMHTHSLAFTRMHIIHVDCLLIHSNHIVLN